MTERELIEAELREMRGTLNSLFRDWGRIPADSEANVSYERMVNATSAQIKELERELAGLDLLENSDVQST